MIKLGKEKRNYEYFELICLLTVLLNQVYSMELMPPPKSLSDMLCFHFGKGKITVNACPSISAISTVPKVWKIPILDICLFWLL